MNYVQQLAACCDVKRWHVRNTVRQQTLAEHQWMVAVLAGELAHRCEFLPDQKAKVVRMALVHDLAEIENGDIPNLSNPEDIKAKIEDMGPVETCIKLADLIDAAWFIRENQVGTVSRQAAFSAATRLDTACQHTWHSFDGIGLHAWGMWTELLG